MEGRIMNDKWIETYCLSKKGAEKKNRTLSANSGKSITPSNPGSAKSKKQSKDKYSHLKNK